MKNILTIDMEDWYQTNDFDFPCSKWPEYEDRIERNTIALLDILDHTETKGTFFVLGYIAQKYPQLIREISARGHEIASHGYEHRMLDAQSREWFTKDLILSKNILQDVTGKAVTGYRAASWSISRDTLWVFEVLEQEGFIYDSSIQPFRTPLSGVNKAPLRPFYPVIDGRKINILEYPSTVLKFGIFKIPFSGGFYLRFWPYWFVNHCFRQVSKKNTAMLYVHPWEIDVEQPRLDFPPHICFVHYYNIVTTASKIRRLIKTYKFYPMNQVIQECTWPEVKL